MKHKLTIAGKPVEIEWTTETAKRYAFRMAGIGGGPTGKQLSNPKTMTVALFQVLWALLPPAEFAAYDSPESLYVAADDDDAQSIAAAVGAIFNEWQETTEKKSTGTKSHSPASNSD